MKRLISILLAVALLPGLSACTRTNEETTGSVDEIIIESGRAEQAGEPIVVKITDGELANLYDYDVYYYGIKNFYVNMGDKHPELRDLLQEDPNYIESLIIRAERDATDGFCELLTVEDGGSREFRYEKITIVKRHGTTAEGGYIEDVIIGLSPLDLTAAYNAISALPPEREEESQTEQEDEMGIHYPNQETEESEEQEQEEINKDYAVGYSIIL